MYIVHVIFLAFSHTRMEANSFGLCLNFWKFNQSINPLLLIWAYKQFTNGSRRSWLDGKLDVFSRFKSPIVLLQNFTTHSMLGKANPRHKRHEAAGNSFPKSGKMSLHCSFVNHPPSTCSIRKWKMGQTIKLNGLLESWSESFTNDVLWEGSSVCSVAFFWVVLPQISWDWKEKRPDQTCLHCLHH